MAKNNKPALSLKADLDIDAVSTKTTDFSKSTYSEADAKSRDVLSLAAKVGGNITYMSPEEDSLLDKLDGLNIVLKIEDGWIRGYNWDKHVKSREYLKT